MSILGKLIGNIAGKVPGVLYFRNPCRTISHLQVHHEKPKDMVERYVCLFKKKDADGWDVRQYMNDLAGYDSIPDPAIIIAGLCACRRLNDYALAVRFLEMVRFKCGNKKKKIWPYIVQEVEPTACKLGIDFPEDLGYDVPELYMQSVFDM